METLRQLADRVEPLLCPHVVPARRAWLTAGYAPTRLNWLGVPVPAVRGVVRKVSRALADQPPEAVLRFARLLASRDAIEVRQVGYEVLARRPDAMALLDRATIERLGRGNDNWASVDVFATAVVGPAWRQNVISDRDVIAWARSRDPWWRRTAIVATVALNTASRGGSGDARRTLLISAAILPGLTPMLAKALSWALRALVAHDPAAVRDFLTRHRVSLPAVVVREVTTKIETGRKARRSVSR